MMAGLAANRPALPVAEIPGEPLRLALDVEIALSEVPADAPPEANQELATSTWVVFQDARGMLYRIRAGETMPDSGVQRLIVDLGFILGQGTAAPEFPVKLVSLEVRLLIPAQFPRAGRFDLVALSTSASMDGDDWQRVELERNPDGWQFSNTLVNGLMQAPIIGPLAPADDGSIAFSFDTGSTFGPNVIVPLTYSIKPAGTDVPNAESPIAAYVSDSFLTATEASVGDDLQVEIAGARRSLQILGRFSTFPTQDPNAGPMILIDMPTFSILQFQTSGRIDDADEWWLAVDNDDVEAITGQLGDAPYSSWRINDRFSQAELLRTDPVALGIIGALSLGFVSAALFAVIGFVVSAAVSARERLTEFSLLRALGLSPRQLSGWLSLENGLLVLISLIGGTALGLLMAWMVLPFVTLTQDASEVVPGIIVAIPWGSILLLEGLTILALAIVVVALALLLRRVGLGSVLRLGEE
jgi:hypothetical protein